MFNVCYRVGNKSKCLNKHPTLSIHKGLYSSLPQSALVMLLYERAPVLELALHDETGQTFKLKS